jgi:hypothetical protein
MADPARIERLPGLLDTARCMAWAAAAGAAIEGARARGDIDAGWSPTSSSLRLRALPGIDARDVHAAIWTPALAAACASVLGTEALEWHVDECWWRRQYPAQAAPPHHHPHAWHQDGALGHDFVARPGGSGDAAGLLPVATCWIALVPCGVDAPGLELVRPSPARVLGLAELDDAALRQATPSAAFERPMLAAGDALVFGGAVVHRTHVGLAMTRVRTSLELRFLPAGLTSSGRASSPRSAA